jgi:hypothetical protein
MAAQVAGLYCAIRTVELRLRISREKAALQKRSLQITELHLTASVLQQADGSVRVQFDANGPRDPALIDRVSRSYDSRMGR